MSEIVTNETALTLLDTFRLPDTANEAEFSNEELAADMDGLQLSFQRVKMPSGGAVVFEMQTDNPEKPDYVPTLTGIIVHHHNANAYWPDGETEDESVPPSCSSNDARLGIGVPGGLCEECALNEFGSGEAGKGKACKNKRHIYLLRDGDYLPILLQLPPTSLNPFSEFVNQAFVSRRRTSYGSLIQIGLKKKDNGNQYSVATFSKLGDFSGPKLVEVKAYALDFRSRIKEHLKARPEESAMEPLGYDTYPDAQPAIGYPVAGQQYSDMEDLPFGPPSGEQEVEDLPFGPREGVQPAISQPTAAQYAAASAGVINGDVQEMPA